MSRLVSSAIVQGSGAGSGGLGSMGISTSGRGGACMGSLSTAADMAVAATSVVILGGSGGCGVAEVTVEV